MRFKLKLIRSYITTTEFHQKKKLAQVRNDNCHEIFGINYTLLNSHLHAFSTDIQDNK